MVDPATKIMKTLLHGSCRLDYLTNRPQVRVPFQLELKPMICFKQWVKTEGIPDDHIVKMPSEPEIVDPEAVIQGYGENHVGDSDNLDVSEEDASEVSDEDGDGDEEGEEDGEDEDDEDDVSDEEKQCYDVHWRECKYVDDHPLIMDKIYYDFRQEWIDNVVEETRKIALDPSNEDVMQVEHSNYPGGIVSKYANSLKLKADPR